MHWHFFLNVAACTGRKQHNAQYFRKFWESILANVLMQEKAAYALRKTRILRDVHTGRANVLMILGRILGDTGVNLLKKLCLSTQKDVLKILYRTQKNE